MVDKKFVAWQMGEIKNAAEKAGIGHALFIAFGTLLGFAREGEVIEHDDDTDFSIMSHLSTEKGDWDFVDNLEKAGLFEARKRISYRKDNNRLVWLSLKANPGWGCWKSCLWSQFKYKNFLWHTKDGISQGGLTFQTWLAKVGRKRGLPITDKTDAVAKGIPYKFFENLIDVEFMGNTYKVPYMYGSCLDFWYPNWSFPVKHCASKAQKHLIVERWDNPKTWKVV